MQSLPNLHAHAPTIIPIHSLICFDAVNYNDDEDGDEHMLKALKNLTPNVRVGPKVSQKQKVNSGQPKPMNRQQNASIAKQVRDGHYNLPDLQIGIKL